MIASDLEALATFLIATAEDNNKELIAFAMAAAAIKTRQNAQSKKHGLRGLYNQKKLDNFTNILLHQLFTRSF